MIYVGEGKCAKTLLPFFKRLRRFECPSEAVAMDMSPAYISAVLEYFPAAVIVFDHFHIIKLFDDQLSDFRRKLYDHAETQLDKDVLKGTRWLLLKNPEDMRRLWSF